MKNIIYILGVALGGCFIGLFAKQLSTVLGCVMFSIGVCLLSISGYMSTKKGK